MSKSLFEISSEILEFEELLTEVGGEVTDEETEARIDKWFEDIAEERDEKLDNYAALIMQLQGRAAIRKAEADRMAKLAKVDQNAADRLKARLQTFFDLHKMERVDTKRFKLVYSKNGGLKPLKLTTDVVDDPELLPVEYRTLTYSPNGKAIREALDNGIELEFAELGEQSKSLKIK